jgi:hypothetical protein
MGKMVRVSVNRRTAVEMSNLRQVRVLKNREYLTMLSKISSSAPWLMMDVSCPLMKR